MERRFPYITCWLFLFSRLLLLWCLLLSGAGYQQNVCVLYCFYILVQNWKYQVLSTRYVRCTHVQPINILKIVVVFFYIQHIFYNLYFLLMKYTTNLIFYCFFFNLNMRLISFYSQLLPNVFLLKSIEIFFSDWFFKSCKSLTQFIIFCCNKIENWKYCSFKLKLTYNYLENSY